MPHPSNIDPTDAKTWPARCPDPDCGVALWRTRQCLGHKWVQEEVDGAPVLDEAGEPRLVRAHCGNCAKRGATVCVAHGARAPAVAAAADQRVQEAAARRAAATYGLPIEVDPGDALMQELFRTAGHVHWLGELVASLEHVDDPNPTVIGDGGDRDPSEPHVVRSGLKQYTRTERFTVEQASVWVQLYQQERKHLVSVTTALLRAGVEERQVRLAEAEAKQVAEALRTLAERLGHDPAEESVRTAMRASLTLIAGGQAA